MMRLRCATIELLLERRSPALSHAERLRVETHLAECEDCRQEHGAMATLIELVEHKVESSAKVSVQERAIARALLKGSTPERARELLTETDSMGGRFVPRLAIGVALAAALVLLAFGLSRRAGDPGGSTDVALEAKSDRLKQGELLLGEQRLLPGDSIPEGKELHAPGAFEARLAHATLVAEKVELLRWSAKQRAVELRGATVDVEVDPSRRLGFRVLTPHFEVDVLGTHFRIAGETVTVKHGRVRVLSREQAPLAELGPGQSWTYRPAEPLGAAPTADGAAQQGPVAHPTPSVGSTESVRGPVSQLPTPELLARARHRLASGDPRAARTDIEAALAAGGSRAQQAEAQMLKADCSLVEGDRSGAVRQYLEVKQRFSGSRVAETALFAAARVESNRGAKVAAKQLLLEYRARYPKGQFRSDVDARLKMLE